MLPVEVKLRETITVREEVTVSATPIQEGQARALNRQRTAPNIVNVISSDQIGQFPDSNAAEATQRIPGVTIERDQGEGRYVAVRGTEPRLNSMMINGERIPSPEGDIRAVAIDVVPTDLLESIEVTKALTPDMDADAIGGAVNLITRGAPSRPVVFGTIAGGYNSLMRDWGQGTFNGTAGPQVRRRQARPHPHGKRERRQPRFGQLRGGIRRAATSQRSSCATTPSTASVTGSTARSTTNFHRAAHGTCAASSTASPTRSIAAARRAPSKTMSWSGN